MTPRQLALMAIDEAFNDSVKNAFAVLHSAVIAQAVTMDIEAARTRFRLALGTAQATREYAQACIDTGFSQ